MLLTSQVISVAFYSEREMSDKFCSEVLISAWGSFTCRKYTTRDPRLYFPSEGSHTQDLYTLKKSIDPGRIWTREPRIQWRVWKPRDQRCRLLIVLCPFSSSPLKLAFFFCPKHELCSFSAHLYYRYVKWCNFCVYLCFYYVFIVVSLRPSIFRFL